MKSRSDSSGISFTALYTGAVWERHGLSESGLTPRRGRALYSLLSPFEAASRAVAGGSLRTFLLQRHRIIDARIADAVENRGVSYYLEIASGLSPRGIRLRRQFPDLRVLETDLAPMAQRKADFLEAQGYLTENHQVDTLDILKTSGTDSLEAVIDRFVPRGAPLIIVTEGLTSYFSLAQISSFWKRLARIMRDRPGSIYLSESYLQPDRAWLASSLKTLGGALGQLTRSDVSFHFPGDQAARNWFLNCGFPDVQVLDPRDFYQYLPIPRSRGNPLVRVIEASS